MALDYSSEIPSQTDTDVAYPQGKAKDVSVPGAGDGTPWYANLVNDLLFGPWQAILKITGTVPSGVPDSASVSQYMEALSRWQWGNLIAANWTASINGSDHYNGVCYSPDLDVWCAVGENGKVFVTDGFSGTVYTIGGTPNLNAVCWSESLSLFVACGDGGAIYTSPDGVTWSSQTSGTTTDLYSIAVKPGTPDTLVAVGAASVVDVDPNAIYSTNATAWTPSDVPFGSGIKSVCWAPGIGSGVFVCMTSGGGTVTSPTGAVWTAGAASGQALARALVWSGHHQRVIAVGNGGKVSSSEDLVTWDEATITGTPNLYAVAVDETHGQVVAFGLVGIWSSFNMTTWYKRLTHTGLNLLAASFSQPLGQTIAVGENGLTLLSLRGLRP